MSAQTYFRICLFVPLMVPLPFLLLKGDGGLSTLVIGSLVFGMPPYVLFFVLPLLFLFGRMSERQIVAGTIFFPILYPLVFGMFWYIASQFTRNVSISLSDTSEWVFIAVVIPAFYAMIFLSGNIIRKLVLGEMGLLERRLAAVLCADAGDCREHMEQDEPATLNRLNSYREVFKETIPEHRGRITNIAADSIVAEFTSVINAVKYGLDVLQRLKVMNSDLPQENALHYCIGIGLGDVVSKGNDIRGEGVDIASCLESLADARGICISGSVYDRIRNKLIFSYEYLGEKSFKSITDPVRAYLLLVDTGKNAVTAPKVKSIIPDKPSIAVLPFDNLSSDPEQEYFSDGITEDIITDLSKLSGLVVISRHSTFVYKEKSISARQVSQELGTRYVLEGSVRKAGNRIRITAKLIDALVDDHVWAGKFDRELDDIFSVQDEVVKQIVNELKINIGTEEKQNLQNKGTENIEAHDSFLKAQENYYKYSREGVTRAKAWLSHAIELDLDYANAYAFKARVLVYAWLTGMDKSSERTLHQAIQLAERAIEINPGLSSGHLYLGWARYWAGEQEEGIKSGKRALELNANDADARLFVGLMLSNYSKNDEALKLMQVVKELNPLYQENLMYLTSLGIIFHGLGRYDDALEMLDKANAINPNFVVRHVFYVVTKLRMGRNEEAKSGVQAILRIVPDFDLNEFRKFLTPKDFDNLSQQIKELGTPAKSGANQ